MADSISGRNFLTIVIVYADYHKHLIERAAASVAAQSIPCDSVVIRDYTGSPARGRNQGVLMSRSPFITFLDADDTLHPRFAEMMLLATRAGHYTICDYIQDGHIHRMPDEVDCDDIRTHLVTSVISRNLFLQLNGFREGIQMEDSEFWMRAQAQGVCPVRVPEGLVYYNSDGLRSDIARNNPNFSQILNQYRKDNPAMACCGKHSEKNKGTNGDVHHDGMIRGYAMWGGNRQQLCSASGYKYPRTGNGKELWVWPEDIQARPDLFQPVQTTLQETEEFDFEAMKADIREMRAG